jgi:hypothetical protein
MSKTQTPEVSYQARPFNARELIAQIGTMNVLAISGGRVQVIKNEQGETMEVVLPVGHGYSVRITLGFMDTWTVRRVYGVKNPKTKGVQEDVYFDEVGEVAYKASCYVNVPFGDSKGQ